jgi:hypothetical protein
MDIDDSPFKKGLYMKVPKGTPLINRWYGTSSSNTSKDVVVEISDVFLPSHTFGLTEAEIAECKSKEQDYQIQIRDLFDQMATLVQFPARTIQATGRSPAYTYPAYTQSVIAEENKAEWEAADTALRKACQQMFQDYKELGESRLTLDDVLVSWSKGDKTTQAKYVQLAEKPEARKKQPKVNLRQQMVPNSRWRITSDVDIMYGAPNPAYHAAVKAWDAANPRPTVVHNNSTSPTANQVWHQAYLANKENLSNTLGEYIPTLYKSLKAGQEFVVTDKFNTYFMPHGWNGERYTNVAPVLFDGETTKVGLEYSHIKDHIEMVSCPTVDVWVLRYKPTGMYYQTSGYHAHGRTEFGVDQQEMVDTFMKGKKWDNLGRAKTSILMMTGYYDNLPGADESIPEWSGGGKSFDMTIDWELVKFDKLARKELGPVDDFHDWFNNSWRLRELTVRFGSSVRTTYKALEKSKLLDSQKGMAVFTVTDEDKLDLSWGERSALTDTDLAEINSAIASIGAKKGSYKQAKDHKSVAVSFESSGAALMFKLAYRGDLQVSVIDLESMKEAVNV